jgi:hypothetical protein
VLTANCFPFSSSFVQTVISNTAGLGVNVGVDNSGGKLTVGFQRSFEHPFAPYFCAFSLALCRFSCSLASGKCSLLRSSSHCWSTGLQSPTRASYSPRSLFLECLTVPQRSTSAWHTSGGTSYWMLRRTCTCLSGESSVVVV